MSSAECEVPSLELASLFKPSMRDASITMHGEAAATSPVVTLNWANIYGPPWHIGSHSS